VRAGRLVEMLLTLQQRGRLTAEQLARQLEVSPRTILRDVEALSGAGIPIFAVQGVGGGIDLVEGFRTRLTGLTTPEAAALLLVGQPAIAHRLGLAVDAGRARRKLLEALPPDMQAEATRLDDWFLHDPDPWSGHNIPHGELRRLATAIERRVEVEITFALVQRTVRPLGLVLKAGEWFLVIAADPSAEVVPLDGLRSTRLTRIPFDPPSSFELTSFWHELASRRPRGSAVPASGLIG
jgi:predicted DNA-binding transcriptional regulator YafY